MNAVSASIPKCMTKHSKNTGFDSKVGIMSQNTQLAIIIPAYKAKFLSAALDSIAAQTCQDFTLYIGDDCSPYNLEDIVNQYRDNIKLVYHRFETNLGGKDLVAQWERCIAMTQGEPYLWLFSDDDIMEPKCVEAFFSALDETNSYYHLYHFDVKKIDEKGNVLSIPKAYDKVVNSFSYYKEKLIGSYMSLVVENIFSRDIYDRCGGFENFDLAWGSDTATWSIFSKERGMYTISGPYVLWRSSSENISPDFSPAIVERKAKALVEFFKWSFDFYKDYRFICLYINVRAFINRMKSFQHSLTRNALNDSVKSFCKIHQIALLSPVVKWIIIIKG